MKLLIAFAVVLFFSISLQAYSKKIIFLSFKDEKKALEAFDDFMAKDEKSSSIKKLAKDNKFTVSVRESGKYYIIVAEPIKNKEVLTEAMKTVRLSFKKAYIANYSTSKKEVKKTKKIKEDIKIVEKKLEPEPVKTKEIILKNEDIKVVHPVVEQVVVEEIVILENNQTQKEDNVSLTQEIKVDQELEKFSFWIFFKWLLFFVVLSGIIFYFLKFKRIYDEY